MFRAIKAAFLLRWPINGLGDVPVNLLVLTVLGILGVANPGFWLAALGLETVYLSTLGTNRRFQRWVDAQDKVLADGSVEQKRRALVEQLDPDGRREMERLNKEIARIVALWLGSQPDAYLLETNQQALRDLQWYYLKLLIARQHLTGPDVDSDAAKVDEDAAVLERDLRDPRLSQAARESKTATLAILRKRAENFGRREQTLKEIASDLERIEAQIKLVFENTTLEGKPPAVATTLDLASQTLDAGFFGSSAADVADLDAAYSQSPPARTRA